MTTANSKSLDTMLKPELLEYAKELEARLAEESRDKGVTAIDELAEAAPIEETFSPKDFSYEEEEDINIRPDKYIRVVSLCPHILNLTTSKHGRNKRIYRFTHLGQEKRIMYQHLVDIIETHPTFTDNGLFYIMNKDVVRRHGLDDAYEKILTHREIGQIIDDDTDIALGIFTNGNERQQGYIAEIIENKMVNDEVVDMNLVYYVGQATGIDILAKVENTKGYKDIDEKK